MLEDVFKCVIHTLSSYTCQHELLLIEPPGILGGAFKRVIHSLGRVMLVSMNSYILNHPVNWKMYLSVLYILGQYEFLLTEPPGIFKRFIHTWSSYACLCGLLLTDHPVYWKTYLNLLFLVKAPASNNYLKQLVWYCKVLSTVRHVSNAADNDIQYVIGSLCSAGRNPIS